MVVENAQNKVRNMILCSKMSGISNFQIEDALKKKKIGDNALLKNFAGVFPSNYMNRFIDHASMISDKGKYPFIIANTDASNKPGVH